MGRSEGLGFGPRAVLVGALSWVPCCDDTSTSAAPPSPRSEQDRPAEAKLPSSSPAVLWTGCDELRRPRWDVLPRICVLMIGPGTDSPPPLRIWVPSSVSTPKAALDGEPLALRDVETIDSGSSFVVQPEHAGRLELGGTTENAAVTLLWLDIEIRPREESALRAQLLEALEDPEAQRRLERQWTRRRDAATSWEQRLLYTRYLQYVTYDQGRWEDSASLATQVADLAGDHGWLLTECRATLSAAYLYSQPLGNGERALEVLERSCDYAEATSEATMKRGYYEGIALLSLGRLSEARRSIELTFDLARRMRLHKWEQIAVNPLVETLAEQGRFGWAQWLLERSQELSGAVRYGSPVERCKAVVDRHDQRGQLVLREARLTGGSSSRARKHWEQAAQLLADEEQCPDHASLRSMAAAVQTELARVELDEGELDAAERRLAAVDTDSLQPLPGLRLGLLRAELLLARGAKGRAKRALDTLGAELSRGEPTSIARSQERWHYHLLRARLRRAQGDSMRAIDALARAQRELDAAAVATGTLTDRYIAMRRQSGQLLVRLLLEQGLVRPALCAARIARARVQQGPRPQTRPASTSERSLGEKRSSYAWYHPGDIPVDELMEIEAGLDELMSLRSAARPVRCEDLPAAGDGEVSLLPFDLGDRWVGMAWDDQDRVVARDLDPAPSGHDPAALGSILLDPFDELLADATALRVILPPSLHETSVSELIWRGRAVGESLAVAHGIDLPWVSVGPSARPAAALVFSDPRQRLWHDRPALVDRFERWATQLVDHGLTIRLDRSPSATGGQVSIDDVLHGTAGVELALLYGFGAPHRSRYHLRSQGKIGTEAEQGTFDLGATGLLSADVLRRAGQVPRHVILAHCDSAMVDPFGISGAMGLAQSYVRAGSDWAVGTAGTVSPETMKVVVDELIEAYVHDSSFDHIAAALRRSKQHLRNQGLPDGERFRLWIP